MKKIHLAAIILFPLVAFAQKDTINILPNTNMIINSNLVKKSSNEVDKQPEFEGGIENFYKQFKRNLEIPNSIKKTKNIISVIFKFTILEDGSITNIKNTAIGYHAPVGEIFIKEVDKALKKLPKWLPAEKDGKKVKYDQVLSWRITIR